MGEKYNIILSQEEFFARTVALGVIVTRPLTVWHYIIPFMFILDFLRRISEIKRYSHHYLFPRKLAIEAARDINNGEDRGNRLLQVEEKIKGWLTSLNLYSLGLQLDQMKVVNLLIDHYLKLFNADGDTYNSLAKNAYGHQGNYEVYLSRLTSVEKEVDKGIAEKLSVNDALRGRLLAEQHQVEKMRKKEFDIIFWE